MWKDSRPDEDTTRRLLRPLIIMTALLGGVSIVAGVTGFVDNFFYPWDGIYLIAVSIGTDLVLSRGASPRQVGKFFVALAVQPMYYFILIYGPTNPVVALSLPALVFMALLGGYSYIPYAAGLNIFFIVMGGLYDQLEWGIGSPEPTSDVIRSSALWIVTTIATGAFSWLFARNLYHLVQVANGQIAALTQTLTTLATTPDLDYVMTTVMQSITEQLGAAWGTLFVLEGDQLVPQGGIIRGEAHIGPHDSLPPPHPAADLPVWQTLSAESRTLLIENPAEDKRIIFRERIKAQNITTILYLPLLAGDDLLGMLSINRTDGSRFTPEAVDLAAALASQLALSMQLTRLAGQAQNTAVLKERNRMAREIHDTLAQGFTGIVVQLEAAEDVLDEVDRSAAHEHLGRARLLARESLAEARRSVWALRSHALETLTLPNAVERMLASLIDGTVVTGEVTVQGVPYPLDDGEHALLRIAQEAVTNALRHGRPTHISIEAHYQHEGVCLRICDDGHGFDVDATKAGFGLRGMRERAVELGGTFRVESSRSTGTIVEVCTHEQ